MRSHVLTFTLLASTLLAGCASPLSNTQKADLNVYRNKGFEVVEKKPGTAKALGLLPGGGSFYTRNYGLGAVNLLFWPLSILWDPFSGENGAETINYDATMAYIERERSEDIRQLDAKLASRSITQEAYLLEKSNIDRRYAPRMY